MEEPNIERLKPNLLSSIVLRFKALLFAKCDMTQQGHFVTTHSDSHRGVENGGKKRPQHALRFMDLPFEIRCYIYSIAIGRQTVHIGRKGFDSEIGYLDFDEGDKMYERAWDPTHWTCSSSVSDSKVFKWYSQPVEVSKLDKSAFQWEFPGLGKEPECYARSHRYCRGYTEDKMAECQLDLRWLWVWKEFRHEASKLLYQNYKFDFEGISDIILWIAAVPTEFQPLIRHIGLPLNFNANALSPNTRITEWSLFSTYFLDRHLAGLTSLDLVINLNSFASCWSIQPAAGFRSVFLPLRSLKNLTKFTVIINQLVFFQGGTACDQLKHADDCTNRHQGHSMEKFWERKEIRRKMADEIMEMVLRKKDIDGMDASFLL